MKATAYLHASPKGWPVARSDPPVTVRCRPGVAHLVGSAAGPVGGDDLAMTIRVDPDAHVAVRSVAAQLVYPGADGSPSSSTTRAMVAAGASLRWELQPTIVVAGARHRSRATVEVAAGGRVAWRDELVLGRHGEAPGSLSSVVRVLLDGEVLVHHELRIGPGAGPGWDGPGGLGAHRAVGTLVVVDPEAWADEVPAAIGAPGGASLLPADGPAVVAMAVGDPISVTAALDEAAANLTAGWPELDSSRAQVGTPSPASARR